MPTENLIVRGAGACQPYGQLVADPGVVGVELLSAIPTDDYSGENVDAKREELHALFARRLEGGGQGAAAHPTTQRTI